jgi:hypothetical protein
MLPAKATRSQRRCDGHQGLHAQVVLRIGLSDATSDIKDIARTLIPLNFVRPVTPKFCEVLRFNSARPGGTRFPELGGAELRRRPARRAACPPTPADISGEIGLDAHKLPHSAATIGQHVFAPPCNVRP